MKPVWWEVLTSGSWPVPRWKPKQKVTSELKTKVTYEIKLPETIMKPQPKENFNICPRSHWSDINSPLICIHLLLKWL